MFLFDKIKTLHKMLAVDIGGAGGGMAKSGSTPPPKTSGGSITSAPWGAIGGAADALGGFLPMKSEYSGKYGALAAGLDSGYDLVANAAMQFGPIGTMAGGIMKGMGLVSKGLNALGGGTDGMTGGDAFLGSSFGTLLTGGLSSLNGFFGSKSDTMEKDYLTEATVGSSYGGTYGGINAALNKAGKKYGVVSLGAKDRANMQIHQAGRTLNRLGNLADNLMQTLQILNNQVDMNSALYNNLLQGGITSLLAAKNGNKLFSKKQLDRIATIKKALYGAKLLPKFVFDTSSYFEPLKLQEGGTLDTQESEKPYTTALKEVEVVALDKSKPYYNEKGYLVGNWGDEVISKKDALKIPEIAEAVNNGGKLIKYDVGGDAFRWVVVPKEKWKEYSDTLNKAEVKKQDQKQESLNHSSFGGEYSPNDVEIINGVPCVPTGEISADGKELYRSLDNGIDYYTLYKNGGQMNVIPEGSLHARKHTMFDDTPDLKGQITTKGIPVVVEKEGGEVEQQAEIEVNEIIFTKKVTQLLEDFYKTYKDEDSSLSEKDKAAIQAGKLITVEVMENTDDRTNLIKTIE